LLASLQEQAWVGPVIGTHRANPSAARAINDGLLHQAITALEPRTPFPPGYLYQHLPLINRLCAGSQLEAIHAQIATLHTHADPYLALAANTMLAAAPGSLRLAFALWQRTRLCALQEVFRIEYIAALACTAHGDFAEGIRALLIDKDKHPRWNPDQLKLATDDWVQAFFTAPWPAGQSHPLADLGHPFF
jgi:enoyl-CoA hydratase/carnithine racemase